MRIRSNQFNDNGYKPGLDKAGKVRGVLIARAMSEGSALARSVPLSANASAQKLPRIASP